MRQKIGGTTDKIPTTESCWEFYFFLFDHASWLRFTFQFSVFSIPDSHPVSVRNKNDDRLHFWKIWESFNFRKFDVSMDLTSIAATPLLNRLFFDESPLQCQSSVIRLSISCHSIYTIAKKKKIQIKRPDKEKMKTSKNETNQVTITRRWRAQTGRISQ